MSRSQDGRGTGWEDHFLPDKYIQQYFKILYWNHKTKKNDISDILINTEKEKTKLDNMVCLKEPK